MRHRPERGLLPHGRSNFHERAPRNRTYNRDLTGLPQLSGELARVLQYHGALNDEQEERATAEIWAAARAVKQHAFDATRDRVPVNQEDDDADY